MPPSAPRSSDPGTPVYRTELSPVGFLVRSASVFPDSTAVVHGDRRLTYRELGERAGRLAAALRQAGLEEGDRVAVLCPNTPTMLEAQFGVPGAGGVLVELVKDLSVRLTPISRGEARAMIDELRVRPLLSGYRGGPARDVEALVDVIVRVAALVDDLPEIVELDLNPVRVHERGATLVDARIRVTPGSAAPR